MSDLSTISPLMHPVQYQGQTYYTSQFFHRQYLANSQTAGKYAQHQHFLRLLRSIEAYSLYIGQDDIIELHWTRIKTEAVPLLDQWKPLFQATGYQPLTLLNATAQVALSHHLDDELSKQLSVTANTLVAREETGFTLLDQYPELKAITEMARSVMALATSTAEARLIAEEAQHEAQQAKRVAAQADAKAEQAIHGQAWLTIHQYVVIHHLERQLPQALQQEYGRYLTGYCSEKNLRVYPTPVAYQRWSDEGTYYVGAIHDTLPQWLNRRGAQTELRVVCD